MPAPLRLCVRRAEVHDPAPAGILVTLRLPSEVGCIEQAVELVVRHCFSGGQPDRHTCFRARVALSEALANAIICGNDEDATKFVDVRIELVSEEIRIHVTDEGEGFDPAAVPEPLRPELVDRTCGRGIFLIRHLVDDVLFNDRGNSICMILRRR